MAENSGEYVPVKSKKPGRGRKLLAAATTVAALAGVGVGTNYLQNRDYGHSTFQTYSLHETAGINYWEDQVASQLKPGGNIDIVDLKITVENGTLHGRYSPTVRNNDDTVADNSAVDFNPGANFEIKDAFIIKGDSVDPNDPKGELWAWVDGKYLGIEGNIFISLSDQTSQYVEQQNPRSVIFNGLSPQGAQYTDSTGPHIASRNVVPAQTTP